MPMPVANSIFKLARILPSCRVLLSSSVPKRSLTRSLFFMSRSRESDVTRRPISASIPWSDKCSCGLHTKGDQQLAAYLHDEIESETRSLVSPNLPKLEGFECTLDGSEVKLTKKMDKEIITIKSNVNNSVDAVDEDMDQEVMDPNNSKEPPPAEMESRPEFTVEVQKGKKILSFHCNYSTDRDPSEGEGQDGVPYERDYHDAFQISEISLYDGEFQDSTYSVSGDIMDGHLYDLLMNYLEERGITSDFAEKMVTFFTAYEHKLYISLLQGMKSFIEK